MCKLVGAPVPVQLPTMMAVDIETTGLEWNSQVLGVSLAWHNGYEVQSCFLDMRERVQHQQNLFAANVYPDIDGWSVLHKIFLNNCHTMWVAFPFDYRHLWNNFSLPVPSKPHDVQHIAKLTGFHPSLSLLELYRSLVEEPPDWVVDMKGKRANLTDMDPDQLAAYARWDAEATLVLARELLRHMRSAVPSGLYDLDIAFTRLSQKMMVRGVPVRVDAVQRRKVEAEHRMFELQEVWSKRGLSDLSSLDKIAKWLVANQVDTSGAAMVPSGKRIQISNDALHNWSRTPGFEKLAEIVEFRELQKAIGSWYTKLLQLSNKDEAVHCELHPFGTRSFRMSAKDINLQGLPMEDRNRAFGSLSGCFGHHQDHDCELWSIDIKQAEIRMAAMLAQDVALGEAFASGIDVYVAMSQRIYGTPNRRNDAKRAALASIYEIGPATFAYKHQVTEEYARQVLDSFRAAYPNIKQASRHYESEATKTGHVRLISGRRRYFGPLDEMYKAFNQRVQGSVAELMETVMLEVEQNLPGSQLLQIHDSLVMSLSKDPGTRQEQITMVSDITRRSVPDWLRDPVDVPMLVDAKPWG